MAKSAADFESEFLAGLKELTRKDLKAWMDICKKSGEEKHNALLKYLKVEHGFNHMQATILASIYKNGGKPVYGNSDALMDSHFDGKASIKPIYDALENKVRAIFKTVEIVPTKGYISFRNQREFAVAKVTKKALRVGMDLGGKPYSGRLEKSKSLGTMPRIGHMVEVFSSGEVDVDLVAWLKEANRGVNRG
jgi:predicted transport protein